MRVGPGANWMRKPLSRAPNPLPVPGEAALAIGPRTWSDSIMRADRVPNAAPDASPCSALPMKIGTKDPARANRARAITWPPMELSRTARRPKRSDSLSSHSNPPTTPTA
ncbi:hypothetical protein SRB17_89260 [Streptomyces sp. RB17]|nr:hypothetical protein [Streptomyces sp. RB17]